MRLNLHTDYALRILMYLATKSDQASVDEIAGAYGISRNHLMKVARSLVELQLIEARRGVAAASHLPLHPKRSMSALSCASWKVLKASSNVSTAGRIAALLRVFAGCRVR
jgi:Rrf2 family nitric oxide-sensitive transcriptional repressor